MIEKVVMSRNATNTILGQHLSVNGSRYEGELSNYFQRLD